MHVEPIREETVMAECSGCSEGLVASFIRVVAVVSFGHLSVVLKKHEHSQLRWAVAISCA